MRASLNANENVRKCLNKNIYTPGVFGLNDNGGGSGDENVRRGGEDCDWGSGSQCRLGRGAPTEKRGDGVLGVGSDLLVSCPLPPSLFKHAVLALHR